MRLSAVAWGDIPARAVALTCNCRGLTPLQVAIAMLCASRRLSSGTIADVLGIEPVLADGQLRFLERRGLVMQDAGFWIHVCRAGEGGVKIPGGAARDRCARSRARGRRLAGA